MHRYASVFLVLYLIGCSELDPNVDLVRQSYVDELGTTTVAQLLEDRRPCKTFHWHSWVDSRGRTIVESRCVLDLPNDPLSAHRERYLERNFSISLSRLKDAQAHLSGRLEEESFERDRDSVFNRGREPSPTRILDRQNEVLINQLRTMFAEEQHNVVKMKTEAQQFFTYPVVDNVVEVTQWIVTAANHPLPISAGLIGVRSDKDDIFLGGSFWLFNPMSSNIDSRVTETSRQLYGSRGLIIWPRDSVESILTRHYLRH